MSNFPNVCKPNFPIYQLSNFPSYQLKNLQNFENLREIGSLKIRLRTWKLEIWETGKLENRKIELAHIGKLIDGVRQNQKLKVGKRQVVYLTV